MGAPEAFFERALSIDPARRPSSAAQVVEQLGAVLCETRVSGSQRWPDEDRI